MAKVHLRMLGCRLNQSEIDQMARELHAQGHQITEDPAEADWQIVNTCAVTRQAEASSRKLIRELHRQQPAAQITVTGCYAQLAPETVGDLPGVVRVVDNSGKDRLVAQMTGQTVQPFDHEPVARELPAGRTRAFVKVQDGCDNACTFCITTVARGAGRSVPADAVIQEIKALLRMGYQEAVLTGVHLGSYGHDQGQPDGLLRLVQRILAETALPRLRLSSLEPWDLTPDFFALWQDPRLLRHLHLPLQSGSDAVLKRMRRHTTRADFRALMQAARDAAPDMRITSDVIVGFPGETEADYAQTRAFVEEMAFAGLHVFPYSLRPGTPAAKLRGHLPKAVKKARVADLSALAADLEARYAQRFTGQQRPVLWEQVTAATADGFVNVGYTDNYIRVHSVDRRPLTNVITAARLTRYDAALGHYDAQALMEYS